MTPTEILIAAREKIEQGWTQNTTARDIGGRPVFSTSQTAVCWCSIGAIYAVDSAQAGDRAAKILSDTLEIERSNLTEWNDAPDRTQDEVLIAFGWAIEASMERGAGRRLVTRGES